MAKVDEQQLEMINARLGRFCFENKTILIQFVQEKHFNPLSSNPNSLVCLSLDADRLANDTWETWFSRCMSSITKDTVIN